MYFESKQIPRDIAGKGIAGVSAFLDKQEWLSIEQAPWHNAGQLPTACFAIAHNATGIYLKYNVSESHIRAEHKNINDAVYKDSCVEFFIAFGADTEYYNLEFNYLGVPMAGFGAGKNDRLTIPALALEGIQTLSAVTPRNPETGCYKWELSLFLPFTIFTHHHISNLVGQHCRANFYKCGDELPQPHFLSWAPLNYAYPEFHLPELFGSVVFI